MGHLRIHDLSEHHTKQHKITRVINYIRAGASLEGFFVLKHRVEYTLSRFGNLKAVISKLNRVLHRVPEGRVTTRIQVLMLKHK
jgi:hypothetical protein